MTGPGVLHRALWTLLPAAMILAVVAWPAPATALTASALPLLIYSFLVDTWWLARSETHGSNHR